MKLIIMSVLGGALLLFGTVSMAYPINLQVINLAGKGVTAYVFWNTCDGVTNGIVENGKRKTCVSPGLGGKGKVDYTGYVKLNGGKNMTKPLGECKIRLKLDTDGGEARLSELSNDTQLQDSNYLCTYAGNYKNTGNLVIMNKK